jgi:hypothetical protein
MYSRSSELPLQIASIEPDKLLSSRNIVSVS